MNWIVRRFDEGEAETGWLSAERSSALRSLFVGILEDVPVFEYRCKACGKKFSALIGMTAEPDDEKCPHCGSTETTKLVSRFARYRNEDERVDALADQLENMGEPESPAQMREMMREMGKAMDEDVSDEMEEMFEGDMSSPEDLD